MDPIKRKIFIKAMSKSLHIPRGETPRAANHGWWNCSDCREYAHKHNQGRVISHVYFDNSGNYYTLDYIEDLMWWLSDQERYEDAAKVKKFSEEWKQVLKTDTVIPYSRYY